MASCFIEAEGSDRRWSEREHPIRAGIQSGLRALAVDQNAIEEDVTIFTHSRGKRAWTFFALGNADDDRKNRNTFAG